MPVTARVLAPAVILVLALSSCSTHAAPAPPSDPRPTTPTTPTATAATAATAAAPTGASSYAALVHAPDALLLDTAVERTLTGFTVAALWATADGRHRAISVSDDGFRGGCCYRGGSEPAWRELAIRHPQAAVPQLHGAPQVAADSLAAGVRAVVSGGDGAGLLPFERVARSVDGGSWAVVDVPWPAGKRPTVAGQVVLPDGRLLVLLDHWSDDHGRPGPQWHGLWVSRGSDWSRYRPWRPRLAPSPSPAPRGFSPLVSLRASGGRGHVVWATTQDRRLYVATGGVRTFREVPDR